MKRWPMVPQAWNRSNARPERGYPAFIIVSVLIPSVGFSGIVSTMISPPLLVGIPDPWVSLSINRQDMSP